jgi:hypothetical protein
VAYWTAPEMAVVRRVRDRVLRACKTAVEDAGMTIPWPIRTLAADRHPLQVGRVQLEADPATAGRGAGRGLAGPPA